MHLRPHLALRSSPIPPPHCARCSRSFDAATERRSIMKCLIPDCAAGRRGTCLQNEAIEHRLRRCSPSIRTRRATCGSASSRSCCGTPTAGRRSTMHTFDDAFPTHAAARAAEAWLRSTRRRSTVAGRRSSSSASDAATVPRTGGSAREPRAPTSADGCRGHLTPKSARDPWRSRAPACQLEAGYTRGDDHDRPLCPRWALPPAVARWRCWPPRWRVSGSLSASASFRSPRLRREIKTRTSASLAMASAIRLLAFEQRVTGRERVAVDVEGPAYDVHAALARRIERQLRRLVAVEQSRVHARIRVGSSRCPRAAGPATSLGFPCASPPPAPSSFVAGRDARRVGQDPDLPEMRRLVRRG